MSFDDIKESAAMAVATVRANKLRSSLTILGVAIGVVTLTFMVSIIQGLNKAFAEQIESLGSNTIFVSKFDPSFGRPPNDEELHRKEITQEDAEAIRAEAAGAVESVAPIRRKIAADLRYADKETDTPILFGVTPEYEYTISQYVGHGRFVVDADLLGRENVAVLAQDVVRALFPYEDPLGKEIKIEGRPFRVVGVMEPLGNFFGQSRDNSVFIPLATFDKYWRDIEPPFVVFFIIIRPHTRADVRAAMDEITDILRRRRQVPAGAKNNFGVSSQDSLLDFYNQLTGATWLVLTAISFVALMIGGIGVMNIMRLGDGAHQGDRRAQGRRRDARQHPLAVPHRGRRAHGAGRRGRTRRRRGGEPLDEQVFAAPGLRAALGHPRRHRHLRERRHRLRPLARLEGRALRPHRGSAL